jgi:hypothetical protein
MCLWANKVTRWNYKSKLDCILEACFSCLALDSMLGWNYFATSRDWSHLRRLIQTRHSCLLSPIHLNGGSRKGPNCRTVDSNQGSYDNKSLSITRFGDPPNAYDWGADMVYKLRVPSQMTSQVMDNGDYRHHSNRARLRTLFCAIVQHGSRVARLYNRDRIQPWDFAPMSLSVLGYCSGSLSKRWCFVRENRWVPQAGMLRVAAFVVAALG